MARAFARASTQYLTRSGAVVTPYPVTMACWAYVLNVTQDHTLMSLSDNSVATAGLFLQAMGGSGGDPLIARSNSNLGAATGTAYPANQWFHAAGVWTTSSNRDVYKNGVVGTNGTNNQAPSTNTTSVGARVGSGGGTDALDGRIAEAAMWNVALTAAEIIALADGASPLFVRPGSLVAYWPLISRASPEIDTVGGLHLTLTNTPTVTDHPRVYYPARVWSIPAPAASGFNGSLNQTLGALTVSATGAVDVVGALAKTLGTLTLAADGIFGTPITGSLAVTLGTLATAATGTVAVAGAAAITLGALTLAEVAVPPVGFLDATHRAPSLTAAHRTGPVAATQRAPNLSRSLRAPDLTATYRGEPDDAIHRPG